MYAGPKPRRNATTTTTRSTGTGSSSFKAPSRNANNVAECSFESARRNINNGFERLRSRSNRDITEPDICDETWPLDQVINKIELNDGLVQHHHHGDGETTTTWHSGPRVISESFDSGRDMKRMPGHGVMMSSFNQGSKTWKDSQVKHHRYKVKKDQSSSSSLEPHRQKEPGPPSPVIGHYSVVGDGKYGNKYSTYDANNNFLDLEPPFDDDFGHDDDSPTLRDVGIQCNLRRYTDFSTGNRKPSEAAAATVLTKKPPIRVIKSTNNGVVSTFSDVPRLSSANGDGGDAIYSQIDKTHKNNIRNGGGRGGGGGGNINIVYKQPLNDDGVENRSYHQQRLGDQVEIKTKGIGLNVTNADFIPPVSLPNPYAEVVSLRSNNSRTGPPLPHHQDREVLEETISIANSSTTTGTDEEQPNRTTILAPSPIKMPDNYSLASKSSSLYQRKDTAGRNSDRDHHSSNKTGRSEKARNHKKTATTTPKMTYENDENVLLENNSLRLKSSRSPRPYIQERLHKSNADLREQFLRDETRGGLATAYRNRQQQQQKVAGGGGAGGNPKHHRTLSLNRMNGGGSMDHHHNNHQNHHQPQRHLSSSHLSGSRFGSDTGSTGGGGYPRGSRTMMQHDRDPIVMYIPPVSSTSSAVRGPAGILRNNSTKSNVTTSSRKPTGKSQSKINLKKETDDGGRPGRRTAGGSTDINRRYSMPKDTKFNWFSKLKLKR